MPNTYRATATRSGRWWSVELHDLPPKHFGFTQGRDLVEAEYMARDAIALIRSAVERGVTFFDSRSVWPIRQ